MRLLEELVMAVMSTMLKLHNMLHAMKADRRDDHCTSEVKSMRRGWFYSLVIGFGAGASQWLSTSWTSSPLISRQPPVSCVCSKASR